MWVPLRRASPQAHFSSRSWLLTGSCPTSMPNGSCLPSGPGWRWPALRKARTLGPELPNQQYSLAPLLVGSPCPCRPGALHPAWGSRGKACKAGSYPSRGLRVPTSTSSEAEGGTGSGLQEVASLRRSTPLFITLSSLGCGVARRCRPCSGHRGEGQVGQGSGGGREAGAPGDPTPPYPFLSSGFLRVVVTHGGLQELDDADTAERGVTPAFRRAAPQPRVLCGSVCQGEPRPAPGPAPPQAPPPETYQGWAAAAEAAGSR